MLFLAQAILCEASTIATEDAVYKERSPKNRTRRLRVSRPLLPLKIKTSAITERTSAPAILQYSSQNAWSYAATQQRTSRVPDPRCSRRLVGGHSEMAHV